MISGNAAQNHTTLDGVANTFDDTTNDVSAGVFLGNSVSITSGTDPFQSPGRVLLNAYSTLDAVDNVTIQAYGVFAGGGADSEVDATLNNYVVIGQDNTITSDGNIGAGTYNSVNAQALSSSTSGSAVGAAQASGYVTINSNQTVTVGTGTTIKAFGNINLTAGDDPTGQYSTNIYAVTNTQAYGDGLIDIPVTYYNASITSNTALNIENNTDIESGSNVIIGAFEGPVTGSMYYAHKWNDLGGPRYLIRHSDRFQYRDYGWDNHSRHLPRARYHHSGEPVEFNGVQSRRPHCQYGQLTLRFLQ